MRITAVNIGLILLALGATALLFSCAYLVGYWNVFGEQWQSLVTLKRLTALPWKMNVGFTLIATAFVYIAYRLKRYACGQAMNRFGLIVFGLAVLAAMYVAIYDELTIMDLYPFAALLVITLLLFRFESRVVAAVLVGIIMLSFYALGTKELGERDAKRTFGERHATAPLVAHLL